MNSNLRSAIWLRRANGYLTLLWLAMIPISLLTGLKQSLPYIVGLSVYALMVGHFSTWVAGRAEVASETNPLPPGEDVKSQPKPKTASSGSKPRPSAPTSPRKPKVKDVHPPVPPSQAG